MIGDELEIKARPPKFGDPRLQCKAMRPSGPQQVMAPVVTITADVKDSLEAFSKS